MSHKFSLRAQKPSVATPYGSKTSADAAGFPILKGLSIYRLEIPCRGFREPHWHANADELTYCLGGNVLVTIFASGNVHARFVVGAGEMFFVPSGSLHAIENAGPEAAELLVTLSDESPEDFGLSGFVGNLTPGVLANTWGLDRTALDGETRSADDLFFAGSAGPCEISEPDTYPHPWKFAIESRAPLLQNVHGSAIVARKDTWPALRHQAMYSVRIGGTGMREPHWHPETAELGYVKEGHARMTVESPGGKAETYELEPGDVYFIPTAYPHHIENLNADAGLHFLIFFDTPEVQDIGFTGAIPALDARVMAPTLGLSPEQFALIPRLPADLLIVGKENPVEG